MNDTKEKELGKNLIVLNIIAYVLTLFAYGLQTYLRTMDQFRIDEFFAVSIYILVFGLVVSILPFLVSLTICYSLFFKKIINASDKFKIISLSLVSTITLFLLCPLFTFLGPFLLKWTVFPLLAKNQIFEFEYLLSVTLKSLPVVAVLGCLIGIIINGKVQKAISAS